MKTSTRLTLALGLAGCTAVLLMALRTDTPPSPSAARKRQVAIMPPLVQHPAAANLKPRTPLTGDEWLLPPPVLPAPAPAVVQGVYMPRPPEESMLSSWAARDPEGAGRWLNQNRSHSKFADMVRGYAIQIATTDPAAARQWAAVLNGNGNRFASGGTLEQHIDAVEAMLKGPAAAQSGDSQKVPAPVILAEYTPRLVRQNPDEPPVLEMQPANPLA